MRTGSAYTSNGIVELRKQLLLQLPEYHRIVFRADSGLFVDASMEFLDGGGHGYLSEKGSVPFSGASDVTP